MTELSPERCPLTPVKSTAVKGEVFWLAVFESMEGAPKIDFGKLAERCGYKNAATARVMFNTKRKAVQQAGDPTASPVTKSIDAAADGTKPKRGRKPKPKEGSEGSEPPKKRGRGRPKKSEIIVPVPVTKSGNSGDEEADTDISC